MFTVRHISSDAPTSRGCFQKQFALFLYLWMLALPIATFAQSQDESKPATTQPVHQTTTAASPEEIEETPSTTTAPASIEKPIDESEHLLERMQDAFAALVDRIGPSVVAVQCERTPASLGENRNSGARAWVSTGSGVIIRADGMILTSEHVIEDAIAIDVILHDGRRIRAGRVAADRRADLAVLRIHADDLMVAELGDAQKLRRGHLVLALGNPLGLSSDGQTSVSQGMISAIGRPLPETFGRDEDRYYGDMIQTSAQIHPGNSGGPLIDIHGRVVGIITAVSTRSDGHEGIGFAVPIGDYTRNIVEKLLHGQHIDYGYLGIQVDRLPDELRRAAKLQQNEGVLLDSVFPDGPAHTAGLRTGDIVLTLNGEIMRSVEEMVRIIGATGPDKQMDIGYVRGGRLKHVKVSLTRRPSTSVQALPTETVSFRGAVLGSIAPAMRATSNLPESAMLVIMVDAGSPADRAGLAPGDIIVRVDGKAATNSATAIFAESPRDVLLGLAEGGSILIKAP